MSQFFFLSRCTNMIECVYIRQLFIPVFKYIIHINHINIHKHIICIYHIPICFPMFFHIFSHFVSRLPGAAWCLQRDGSQVLVAALEMAGVAQEVLVEVGHPEKFSMSISHIDRYIYLYIHNDIS